MAVPPDDDVDEPLNERLLDLFVFAPAGLAVSLVEEFPALAARGRERLGVRVSSARSVGQFVVKAGHDEIKRRSERLIHRDTPPADALKSSAPPKDAAPKDAAPTASVDQSQGSGPTGVSAPTQEPTPLSQAARQRMSNGHVPAVATLSIPGFDTLSASQVVQRLDGLTRSELVSVRAYESANRGRRTILSRVDQLLDERS
jgi:hypothetical protein